jgi:hypothetical protein
VDWNKIKAEYIAGGTSYRKLAEKHGVSFSTLRGIAEREKWTDLKTQAQHNADTKLVETIGDKNSTHSAKIDNAADKILDKIISMLEMDDIGSQSIRHLTSSLKDIKEIKGIKSDIDLKEQNARIDKLRKEIEGEQKDASITVTFEDEVKKYAN